MFTVQLGHPKIIQDTPREFEKMQDIFLAVFREVEESAYLFWNDIPIRLRYREDLYRSFNDMLALVWMLQKEPKGSTKATLINQLMEVQLTAKWENDDLSIDGAFKSFEYLYRPLADALSRQSEIRMSRAQFLREWKTLFRQLIEVVESSGHRVQDGVERRRYELLTRVEASIDSYGLLYVE
ncbi:MAG: hypothetical protein AAF466_02200 [Bacteroidota bacterium]